MTQDQNDMLLVVGTYTTTLPHVAGRGAGIHLIGFNSRTGAISDGPAFGGVTNPTWLTVSKDARRLYSVQECAEDDGAAIDCFALDTEARSVTHLASVPSQGSWPCHLSLDKAEQQLFVANYVSGRFATIRLDADRVPTSQAKVIQHEGSSVNSERQEGPHLHQAVPTPDGRHVIVCDAGLDRLIRYPLTEDGIAPTPDLSLDAEPGSFPRHLAFLPDGSGCLVIHELANTVVSYAMAGDAITRCGSLSILPQAWTGASSAAALHIHPSGRFAYASNRGHDSLCAIDLRDGLERLSVIGWYSACGKAPRDFTIDPSGRFLIVATQDSDNLAIYEIDSQTGELSLATERYSIGTPVCLAFVNRQIL